MNPNKSFKTWTTKNGVQITRIMGGRSNVFLCSVGGKHLLVDTSVPRLWSKLQKRLHQMGIMKLDYLILTHGNAFLIQHEFGARVVIHAHEEAFLLTGNNPIPKGTNFIVKPLVQLLGKIFLNYLRYIPCKPGFVIHSDIQLPDFGNTVSIIHTPGHSPGSQSILIDNEIALVGDAMFGIFKGSIFPPFACNVTQMIESWGRLLETEIIWFLPSHGSSNHRSLVQKEYLKRRESYQT